MHVHVHVMYVYSPLWLSLLSVCSYARFFFYAAEGPPLPYTVRELKEFAKMSGVQGVGKKADIVARIVASLPHAPRGSATSDWV